MANTPLYDMVMGGQQQQAMPAYPQPTAPQPIAPPLNPMQRMQMVMQAMNNPYQFLKQKFPDIPDEYANNPNAIMQYLQQTRNIPDQAIQQVAGQIPRPF